MFRNIYRALVLSRTKSAAIKIADQLDQRSLNDIGVSRYELVQRSVKSVHKELDQADRKREHEAGSKVAASNVLSDFIENSLLRPLGSSSSYNRG